MAENLLDKRLANIPSEIWQQIAQIDELKGRFNQGIKIMPDSFNSLKKSALISSAGASTRIEGAKLSDEEVENLIKGITIQKLVDRDSQEAKGYFELLSNVFDNADKISISENSIKSLHKQLLKYVDKDTSHRGNYKTTDNKVVAMDPSGKITGIVFDTTPPYLTTKQMSELVLWTQDSLKNIKIHPILVIINFVVEFLKIHPFQDGNGRLSRILTNLLLLKQGYQFMPFISHEKLIEDNKTDYYLALRRSQKTFGAKEEDISSWLEFFLLILHTQAKQAVDLLSADYIETTLSSKQMEVWQFLQSVNETSAGEIAVVTKISRPTVNQVLEKLLRLKKIEKIGLGSATRYRKI